MSQKEDKFYTVTMRVEVERRVIATSEEEALLKVDTSDMIDEIKNYGFSEELFVEEQKGSKPDAYARIEDIAEQIVKHRYEPMYLLKERYAKIRKINEQLINEGEEPMEPRILNRFTDSFLEELMS